MSDKTSIGDRMKRYEKASRIYLTPRMPIIIRCDGKAFHTYTKGFEKPWDGALQTAMTYAASVLISEIPGVDFAYIQSDEISLLINTYKKFNTAAWFDGNMQKIASVSASIVTASFNTSIYSNALAKGASKPALFDSRCFIIPREEVVNYFHWREIDAIRNSISGYAQANFSHKELHKKSTKDMKEMLIKKGLSWERDVSTKNKRGWCVVRTTYETNDGTKRTKHLIDNEIPLFSKDRNYIGRFLIQEEV